MSKNEIADNVTEKKINWFPGHMKNALQDIEDNKITIADCILYVLDSRAPTACINPKVDKIVHHKPIIYVLNKIDLADEKRIEEIQKEYEAEGKITITSNSSNNQFRGAVKNALKKVLSDKILRNKDKGITPTYKVLVLGVPNTGKSTLINMLSGERKTKASNTPGVTRANQWIRIDEMFILCDTPGILWPKFDEEISKNLAYIGCLSDKQFDMSDLGYELMKILYEKYPENIKQKFDVDYEFNDFIELYDRFCIKRGFIMRKNEIDYTRAGKTFIDDFRAGKFGKITLE